MSGLWPPIAQRPGLCLIMCCARLPIMEAGFDLGVAFAIDTHANDLTSDYIDRLLRSRLTSINFSLDSMDAEDYPRIRRGSAASAR